VTGAGFAFREVMIGSLSPADATGGRTIDLELRLSVDIADLDRFLADPSHEAAITGEIRSRALGGRIPVDDGSLHLFPADYRARGAEMHYRLRFRRGGESMTLIGLKTLERGHVGGAWRHLTQMDTRLTTGSDELARGVTRITPIGVAREMTTLRGRGPTLGNRIGSVVRFGWFFGITVLSAYRPRRAIPA
jgi:hypothetical protein